MAGRRVAMVSRYYLPFIAGAECQIRLLAELLLDELDLCEVITTRYRPDLPRLSEEGGVRVRRLRTWRGRGTRLASFLGAFFYFLVHGRRYDVVHVHCLSAFCLGAVLGARLRGARTMVRVCTVGVVGEIAKVKKSRFGPALWSMFLLADGFISQTPSMVSHLRAHGVPESKICTIPNIVLPPRPEAPAGPTRADLRARLGLPDRPVVLYVGRLHTEKGLDRLLSAWPEIVRHHDATLVLVGDGPEFRSIERWRQESGLAASVQMIGWREDPQDYYRAADVFVFPSREEAFGVVLVEAMIHGLAVVTTPVGMALDWLRDQENCVLLRGGDPAELARAVVDLLADSARRERLGRQARQDALASFVPDQVVPSYLQIYELPS